MKCDVLTDLPNKVSSVEKVPMSERQSQLYFKLVSDYKDRAVKVRIVNISGSVIVKYMCCPACGRTQG